MLITKTTQKHLEKFNINKTYFTDDAQNWIWSKTRYGKYWRSYKNRDRCTFVEPFLLSSLDPNFISSYPRNLFLKSSHHLTFARLLWKWKSYFKKGRKYLYQSSLITSEKSTPEALKLIKNVHFKWPFFLFTQLRDQMLDMSISCRK